MVKQPRLITLTLGAFVLVVALGGIALMSVTTTAAAGCTGPVVQRCDYIASATAAVRQSQHHPFQDDLGFEIFDQGSSVLVQQFTPPGEPGLNHAPSVLIDKKSCRACKVDWHLPTGGDPRDPYVGPLLTRVPAADPVAAAARSKRWDGGPGGTSLL